MVVKKRLDGSLSGPFDQGQRRQQAGKRVRVRGAAQGLVMSSLGGRCAFSERLLRLHPVF